MSCGHGSKNTRRLLLILSAVFCFSLWPISSAVADHVLTDQQYQQFTSNLTQLAQITQQQQDKLKQQEATLQSQAQTLSKQQATIAQLSQTISSLQDSLQQQASLLPKVKQSFDQALRQERTNSQIWRFVGVTMAGGAAGYALDKGTGALIGAGGCAVIDGFLWLIGK